MQGLCLVDRQSPSAVQKMFKSSSVGWLCFTVVIAIGIQVRGQTPGTQSAQPLPTTGTVESRIGPLAFEGGYPTDATFTKLYDETDFQRATQTCLWAIPIVSFAKWQEQTRKCSARRMATSCRW